MIPVSKISVFGSSWSNFGGWRWIGSRRTSAGISPASSTGSPSTFMIRPRAASPTGTEMAEPVSMASMPRWIPSVEDIETARTWPRPMCCWTSAVTSRSSPDSDVAFTRTAL